MAWICNKCEREIILNIYGTYYGEMTINKKGEWGKREIYEFADTRENGYDCKCGECSIYKSFEDLLEDEMITWRE